MRTHKNVARCGFALQRRDLGVEQFVVHGDLAHLGFQPGNFVVAGPHAGNIVIEADSQTQEFSTWDEWCDRDLLRSVIFPEPIRRDATVRLTVTDRGGCSRSDPGGVDGVPKLLKLIDFMLYDECSSNPAVDTAFDSKK